VKNQNLLIFLIKFFIIFFILSTIIEFLDFTFLREFITYISATYTGVSFSGSAIFIGVTKFVVVNSCTGLVSGAILLALIFAGVKPDLKNKGLLALFGVCLILIINIPRVMLVLITAKLGLDAELVHIITWFMMSGIVILIWYYGNKLVGTKEFNELI
jgi:exosortase/archaeosortase family protein